MSEAVFLEADFSNRLCLCPSTVRLLINSLSAISALFNHSEINCNISTSLSVSPLSLYNLVSIKKDCWKLLQIFNNY